MKTYLQLFGGRGASSGGGVGIYTAEMKDALQSIQNDKSEWYRNNGNVSYETAQKAYEGYNYIYGQLEKATSKSEELTFNENQKIARAKVNDNTVVVTVKPAADTLHIFVEHYGPNSMGQWKERTDFQDFNKAIKYADKKIKQLK